MIITREIINKNIKIHDIHIDHKTNLKTFRVYTYNELCIAIDLYKNLLIDCGVKPQETVTIGERNSIWQIAALFASFELGLKVSITNYYNEQLMARLNHNHIEIDSKTKCLLPIDYIIQDPPRTENPTLTDIKKTYNRLVGNIEVNKNFGEEDLLNNIVVKEYPYNIDPSFIATKSSTSGTTGSPKCIQHSHNFLYELVLRNSKFFSGNFISLTNLNHGSSIFCYLIPCLASVNVVNIYNVLVNYDYMHELIKYLEPSSNEEFHILLPYPHVIDLYLNFIDSSGTNFPNKTIHTLTYIPQEWKERYYSKGLVKDIVSNFGSNETTGPIFLNKISDINFNERRYKIVDNFFDIEISKCLKVNMPVYNKSVKMNDEFEIDEFGSLLHKGRLNFIRINDLEVNLQIYSDIVQNVLNATIIYDQIKSKIYLAIWEDINKNEIESCLKNINEKIKNKSFDLHHISKYSILKYEDYLSGIKLDMEKIREYFRNPNENYTKLN